MTTQKPESTTDSTTTSNTSSTPTTGSTTGTGSDLATSEGSTTTVVAGGGRTSIADVVVSKIAGIATREISGVHDLGGGASRAVGALRERIPGSRTNLSQGVSVEVGEKQAAVDLDIVAEYGVAIPDLAAAIRRNVVSSVERMTGLSVTEVNLTVHDIFLDDGSSDDDSSAATPARTSRVE